MSSWFLKKKPSVESSESPKKSSTGPWRVSDLIGRSNLAFEPAVADKRDLIKALAKLACEAHGIVDWPAFYRKVLEREGGISTTLDTGLSLPHARMDDLDGVIAALAVLRKPIADPQQRDLPIRLMFLFFSPNRREFYGAHLAILRDVASFFTPELIDRLAKAASADEILQLLGGS